MCILLFLCLKLLQFLFFLQGREWYATWVALTDLYPVIVQLEILPFVDIGGTLNINIHLDELLVPIKVGQPNPNGIQSKLIFSFRCVTFCHFHVSSLPFYKPQSHQ